MARKEGEIFVPNVDQDDWDRAKDALEVILETFSVKQVEKLAIEMSKPGFKDSFKWKIFKNQIL